MLPIKVTIEIQEECSIVTVLLLFGFFFTFAMSISPQIFLIYYDT